VASFPCHLSGLGMRLENMYSVVRFVCYFITERRQRLAAIKATKGDKPKRVGNSVSVVVRRV